MRRPPISPAPAPTTGHSALTGSVGLARWVGLTLAAGGVALLAAVLFDGPARADTPEADGRVGLATGLIAPTEPRAGEPPRTPPAAPPRVVVPGPADREAIRTHPAGGGRVADLVSRAVDRVDGVRPPRGPRPAPSEPAVPATPKPPAVPATPPVTSPAPPAASPTPAPPAASPTPAPPAASPTPAPPAASPRPVAPPAPTVPPAPVAGPEPVTLPPLTGSTVRPGPLPGRLDPLGPVDLRYPVGAVPLVPQVVRDVADDVLRPVVGLVPQLTDDLLAPILGLPRHVIGPVLPGWPVPPAPPSPGDQPVPAAPAPPPGSTGGHPLPTVATAATGGSERTTGGAARTSASSLSATATTPLCRVVPAGGPAVRHVPARPGAPTPPGVPEEDRASTDTGPRVGAALPPEAGGPSRPDQRAVPEVRPTPARGRSPAVTVRPG